MLRMARRQQLLRHVKRQKRSHPVIGEALPHLGEGEIGESLWMAEKAAAGPIRRFQHGRLCCGQSISSRTAMTRMRNKRPFEGKELSTMRLIGAACCLPRIAGAAGATR